MGSAHASALYQSIHRQPDVLRNILRREADATERAAEVLAQARRVYLTGTGTSGHAAVVTEYLYRSLGLDAEARSAFDLTYYGPHLRPEDVVVVISHRGSKRYGNRVLELVKEAGARSLGVTGQDSPMAGPEVILRTAPQETSSTHTMSYTGSLLTLALAGAAYAERGGGRPHPLRPFLEGMPEAYEDILRREHVIRPIAQSLVRSGRLVLAGAGPNVATAREGALKVKESSYLVAEGFEFENLLHGGLQSLNAGDTAAVILPHGPAAERATDIVRSLRILGVESLVIRDRAEPFDAPMIDASSPPVSTFLLPEVPELLSPMTAVLPLQMLACFAAELRGTNPDLFRADDPTFKRINDSYTL